MVFDNNGKIVESTEIVARRKELEYLEEVAAFIDSKNGFSIHITSSSNYNNGQSAGYFKWVDNIDFNKAKHIARIKFNSSEYVYHNDPNGKIQTELSSKQKKQMMQVLEKNITNKQRLKLDSDISRYINTGWEYLIYTYNIYIGYTPEFILENIDKFPFDPSLPLNFISMKTPMPNYMRLSKNNKY